MRDEGGDAGAWGIMSSQLLLRLELLLLLDRRSWGRTYLCHGTGRTSPWLATGRTVATGCAELYWDVQKGRDPI